MTQPSSPRSKPSIPPPFGSAGGDFTALQTEARRSTDELQNSQRLLRIAGRVAHVGGWVLELPERVLRWSDEVRNIHEVPLDFMPTPEQALEFYAPEWREVIRAAVEACVRDGTPWDLELEIITARGRRRWVRAIGEARGDASGVLRGVQGALQDISDQKNSAAELTRLAARLTTTLESITDAFFTVDGEWRFTYVNHHAETVLQRDRASLLGRSLLTEFPEAGAFHAHYQRAMRENVTVRFEERFAPLGIWVCVDAYPSPQGLAVYFRDVSVERAAAEELRLLQASVARLNDVVIITGVSPADGSPPAIVFVNDAFERHTGYRRAEVLGRSLRGLHEKDTPAATLERIETAMRAFRPLREEVVSYTKDGRMLWLELDMVPVADPRGAFAHFVAIERDVSERKQNEALAQESAERLRLLSKATNDAIWDWDLATDQVWWNDCFETLVGVPHGQIEPTSESWMRRIHPEDRDRVVSDVRRVIDSGGDQWQSEYRLLHETGGWRYVLDRGYMIRNAAGEAVRMVGGMTDLTERRRAEERIADQAALLDHATDAILLEDLDGTIRMWNEGAERIYGVAASAAVGRKANELLRHPPEEWQRAREHLLMVGSWRGELRSQRLDGRQLVIEVRWTLVRDTSGAPRSILAIETDITEKKKLETQLLRSQRMESLGTLAGGIAHDLNNVLTPILVSVELLRLGLTDLDLLESVETLEISARRGADMVKQVLSFARGVEGERTTVNPHHVALEVARIVTETFPRSIQLDVRASHDLWSVTGSPTQLNQVLLNLCVNARDAMPRGGTLGISLKNGHIDEVFAGMNPDARPGPHVVIEVRDNGIGIPADVQERVFDPFFTTKEVGKGTGLGLSTVVGIVKSHGGVIHLYSEQGKGTTFTIYLPASGQAAPHLRVAEREEVRRGAGETVLLIDDERAVCEIMQRTLERFGYRVLTAGNGAEGLSIFAEQRAKIDVVITDMSMPIMDGPATIVALRTIDPRVRIIASSGFAGNGMAERIASVGVHHLLPKPYSAVTVLDVLAEVLRTGCARRSHDRGPQAA